LTTTGTELYGKGRKERCCGTTPDRRAECLNDTPPPDGLWHPPGKLLERLRPSRLLCHYVPPNRFQAVVIASRQPYGQETRGPINATQAGDRYLG